MILVSRGQTETSSKKDKKKEDIVKIIVSAEVNGIHVGVGLLEPPSEITSQISIIDPFDLSAVTTVDPKMEDDKQVFVILADCTLQALAARISYQDIKMILSLTDNYIYIIQRHTEINMQQIRGFFY